HHIHQEIAYERSCDGEVIQNSAIIFREPPAYSKTAFPQPAQAIVPALHRVVMLQMQVTADQQPLALPYLKRKIAILTAIRRQQLVEEKSANRRPPINHAESRQPADLLLPFPRLQKTQRHGSSQMIHL